MWTDAAWGIQSRQYIGANTVHFHNVHSRLAFFDLVSTGSFSSQETQDVKYTHPSIAEKAPIPLSASRGYLPAQEVPLKELHRNASPTLRPFTIGMTAPHAFEGLLHPLRAIQSKQRGGPPTPFQQAPLPITSPSFTFEPSFSLLFPPSPPYFVHLWLSCLLPRSILFLPDAHCDSNSAISPPPLTWCSEALPLP
ncbi:hypothetical protein CVT26_014501 [Gymnopilus dilepis]|uniref:Uncharacterized protein n=1 Tax=Gymnopilus dilepis TaxID=231916 RepID=A0A409WS52_9AGAR|nr:hypothetical protein CVT26_014501 [Gymnopilus dilepis]